MQADVMLAGQPVFWIQVEQAMFTKKLFSCLISICWRIDSQSLPWFEIIADLAMALFATNTA